VRAPVLLLALLLVSCGGASRQPAAPSVSVSPVAVLSAGKSDLPLHGSYLSPDGFVPSLALTVPAGWTSTHRGDDAFDLSRPNPSQDAPLVVVALITPKDDAVETALARLRSAAKGIVTTAVGTLDGQPATGFEEVGGSGELIASPSGTLALDAYPKGHLLVLGTDIEDVPLLAVVVVPDGTRWAELKGLAQVVLSSITPA
jgi:hypothetical protein